MKVSYGQQCRAIKLLMYGCLIINAGVKVGLVFSWQNKWILLLGIAIDFMGMVLLASLRR